MKLRIYNKTLDPKIWNENKILNPDVKEALLKIAEDFYNNTDLKSDIHNILFLGSSANYNWTDSSDIDLHVVIDIAEEKINEEYARRFMDGLAAKWNTDHEITVKKHPVEVYLQDVREPNATAELSRPGAAIYSIFDDKWVVEPNPQNIKIDADKVRKKYHELKDRITNLIQLEDIEKLKALMVSIRNYRNAGMSEGGEFSVENIVFKALRHSGALEKLKTAVNTIYDRKASLPEEGNIPTYKKTQPLLNELSTMENEINRSDWKEILNDMKVWLILESNLGNIVDWYSDLPTTDDPETLVKTLRGIESCYEGGITGFLQDYDSGVLKENIEKKDKKEQLDTIYK